METERQLFPRYDMSIAMMKQKPQLHVIDIEKDTETIARLAEGQRSALKSIMDAYLSGLTAFVRRLIHEPSDAEDIVQETFLRLWQYAPQWKKGGRIKPWLYTTAYRQAIDMKRKTARLKPLDETALASLQTTPISDQHRSIENKLRQLPERQSVAVDLVYIQGYSHMEAAHIMGISPDALTSLVARARRELIKKSAKRRTA